MRWYFYLEHLCVKFVRLLYVQYSTGDLQLSKTSTGSPKEILDDILVGLGGGHSGKNCVILGQLSAIFSKKLLHCFFSAHCAPVPGIVSPGPQYKEIFAQTRSLQYSGKP